MLYLLRRKNTNIKLYQFKPDINDIIDNRQFNLIRREKGYMKKIFKKIFMIVTTILLVVTFTSFFKVNADINTTSDLVVVGAQVRTDEKSGIKFTAQSTFVPREDWGVREYGIVVMLGNYPIEEVYIGATNAFDARVSKTDDEGFFYLTILISQKLHM